jgi:predicted RNase H-like nuclease (RuvC/YqgF family)
MSESEKPDKATLEALALESAFELAEYASYAEIVGGVTHNRTAIRAGCDALFDLRDKLRRIEQEENPTGISS